MLSFGIDTAPQIGHNRLLHCVSMIRCSKSARKSVVEVCRVDTVVMETTQLVLSQFKTFFAAFNVELNKVCLCQKKLMNVVNWRSCSGPVF